MFLEKKEQREREEVQKEIPYAANSARHLMILAYSLNFLNYLILCKFLDCMLKSCIKQLMIDVEILDLSCRWPKQKLETRPNQSQILRKM